ncbi:MAG TPA: DUF4124 domain-containing protein [Gammaproteobacteria bacterium]|nr:DUF4124 domain-containing protein [Gammaproteobacteria bacterium]
MRFIFLTVLFLVSPWVAAQDVYRSVDSDGVPLFSDRKQEGAEKLDIAPLPTVEMRVPEGRSREEPDTRGMARERSGSPVYSKVVIEEPADDSVIWANGNPLSVVVTTDPPFSGKSGHAIGLRLDGKLADVRSQLGNITLTNVDRGTHTLQAVILDASGDVVAQSEPVTFHLKRHSILYKH